MPATPRYVDFSNVPDKPWRKRRRVKDEYVPPAPIKRHLTLAENNGTRLIFERASTIRTETTTWLYQDRIPLGEFTLVAGREGTGKGLFVTDLVAQITKGDLPGYYKGEPMTVAIAAHEDNWRKTLAPRLIVAGADLSKVGRLAVDDEGRERKWSMPDDLPYIANLAAEDGVGLLVIDPLISAIDSGVDLFKSPKVRPVLEEFRMALETAHMAAIGIVHFNKNSEGDSWSKVANSRAFVEVARSGITLAEDKQADESGIIIVSQDRNNLGRTDLPNMAFRKIGVPFRADDGGKSSVGKLEWVSHDYARNAGDALNVKENRGPSAYARMLEYMQEVKRPVNASEVATAIKAKEENVRQCFTRAIANGSIRLVERGIYQAT